MMAHSDGTRDMPETEFVGNLALLIVGGNDTTRNSMSGVDLAKPRQYLSYGAGIHRRVGDRLADLQLRVLWEEILARNLDIEVVGPSRRLYSNFIRGIRELPARIRT